MYYILNQDGTISARFRNPSPNTVSLDDPQGLLNPKRENDTWVEDATKTNAEIVAGVKSEAQRRINALAPEWKQRNMIARSVELTEKIASGGTLTTAEQSERTAIENVWSQVKAIRSKSDQLEVSKPTDYTNDSHWT